MPDEKKLYRCEICSLAYPEKEWADKCLEWCSAHDSCNIAVARHAVK